VKAEKYIELLQSETFGSGDFDGMDNNASNIRTLERHEANWSSQMQGCPHLPDDDSFDPDSFCETRAKELEIPDGFTPDKKHIDPKSNGIRNKLIEQMCRECWEKAILY
jgi:hypothetical protein